MDPLILNSLQTLNPDPIWLEKYLSWIVAAPVPNKKDVRDAHHILPKKIFPEFGKFFLHSWNKRWFSPQDHLIAHYYLYKALPGNRVAAMALWFMIGESGYDVLKKANTDETIQEIAEAYEQVRIAVRQHMLILKTSPEAKEKASKEAKALWTDPEFKERMAAAQRKAWESRSRIWTVEHCKAISDAKRKRDQEAPMSPELRKKQSDAHRGRKKTAEHVANVAASLKKKWEDPEYRDRWQRDDHGRLTVFNKE